MWRAVKSGHSRLNFGDEPGDGAKWKESVWGQSQWGIINGGQDLQSSRHKGGGTRKGKIQHKYDAIFHREKLVCIHSISLIHFQKFHFKTSECIFQLIAVGMPSENYVTIYVWPLLLRSRKCQLPRILELTYELNASDVIQIIILKMFLRIFLILFYVFLNFFKRFYLFVFREVKGETEGEKHQCVVASCTPPTGDLACNPSVCPDWESNSLVCRPMLNPLSHTSPSRKWLLL